MTQLSPAPSGATAFQDPNASPLNYGLPQTTQGAQFLEEEQAAAAARGQSNPFSGWSLPKQYAGDFWALYQLAENFAAATGWKYLPTPQLLVTALQDGVAQAPEWFVYDWFAKQMGFDINSHPWVQLGLSQTDFAKARGTLDDSVYQLTGMESWEAAGLPGNPLHAIQQGWSSQQISDYIQKTMPGKYGYLRYGYNYQTFQNYKAQNQQSLQSRYGTQFTDAQAIENLGKPLPTFHASGGAFGQSVPYVQSQSNLPSGFQSAAR